MSRILSYPHVGTLKLYQVNNHVHMSSLKRYFNNLLPDISYKTTYKFVEPNRFIPLKDTTHEQTFSFHQEDDRTLVRTLQVFQRNLNIPFDTYINIEAKRSIMKKNNENIPDWKTFDVSKVGIINVSCQNIHNINYHFRDINNDYVNKNPIITLNQGQMIGYDENSLIEHRIISINMINDNNIGVYDQLIFSL